jgi:hypothetical protein
MSPAAVVVTPADPELAELDARRRVRPVAARRVGQIVQAAKVE